MPSPLSFLQAAVSAKRGSVAAPSFFTENNNHLQLLLVEDDNKTLAYSLAMDAAYSLVSSSSSFSCRGCGFSEKNACRCCKVAMLVTRSQNTSDQGRQSPRKSNNNEGDIPFPLWCHQEGTNNDVAGYDRDQSEVLNHIHIKYVNTVEDVIRYLAYAPSLPKHMMPSSGIFIMGLGELITQQMELTHVLSLLSDTGCVLGTTTLVATLNQQMYSSLPPSVYKQLGFSDIAAIHNNTPNSATSCELVFEDQKTFASSRASFSFTQTDEDTIVWSI